MQGLGDGHERLAGTGQDGDAVFFRRLRLCFSDAAAMAADQIRRSPRSARLEMLLFVAVVSESDDFPRVFAAEIKVQIEMRRGSGWTPCGGLSGRKCYAAAVVDGEDLGEDLVEAIDEGGVVRKLAVRETKSKRSGSAVGISRPNVFTRGKSSASASRKK